MNRKYILCYKTEMVLGIHEYEQVPQRVNIKLEVEVRGPTTLDGFNYDILRKTLQNIKGPFLLQETLCETIIEHLQHPAIYAIKVYTEKPDVYSNATIGVEMYKVKYEHDCCNDA
jgi:dihydroneopterin aldolase